MSGKSILKHTLKQLRWRARRTRTAVKWGSGNLRYTPRVFGNAMPKSGSHLLTQVLHGLTELGPFVDPGFPPVNRDEANQPLPDKKVFDGIYRMRPGDIRYGYIHAKEPFVSLLTQPEQATIFIYRDPRDMLVSHVFYATDMYEDHGMHRFYEQLDSMEARLNAAIEGVADPEFFLSSVKERYESYLGWLDHPEIFCLRFEDLILERDAALARLLGYLEVRGLDLQVPRDQAVEILKAGITPHKSGTFRKGQPGNWQEHFTATNKARFKEVAGDLLGRLGYEDGEDW
jgi:sulfotransferase 6B1